MPDPTPKPETVTQVYPEQRVLPLEGLYLGEELARVAAQRQKAVVLTSYLTDADGVIAKADERHHFEVPAEIRNPSDWRLFQELMAQADVLISAGDYLRRVSAPGKHHQDILHQFEAGGEFEELGEWRLRVGYEKRSPDLAVVTRQLDFEIPGEVIQGGRRVYIFTTYGLASSERAKALTASGTVIVGSGEAGVEGRRMIDYLADEVDARVIVMATGPGVLQLLLAAKRLDFLYITQVQREIRFEAPSSVKTLLSGGNKVQDLKEFRLTHEYSQDNVVTADGSLVSQLFLRYDRK